MVITKRQFILSSVSLILVAASGFPILKGDVIWICIFILLLWTNLYFKNAVFNKRYVRFSGFIMLIVLGQYFIFGKTNFVGFIGFFLKVSAGFFAILYLKNSFTFYYIKWLKFFAILSLIIVVPSLLSSSVAVYLDRLGTTLFPINFEVFNNNIQEGNLIFYHFNRHFTDSVRNSGPFWEAGAFGGYLVLALILNTIRIQRIISKTNLIFLSAIISTFSSTTYIATFTFVVLYNLITNKNIFYFFVSLALIFVGIITYNQIPILKNKINAQFSNYEEAAYSRGGDTRFGSAYLDLIEFVESPVFGRGLGSENKNSYNAEVVRRNNGLTGFLNSFGIILFSFYWYYAYKAVLSISGKKGIAILVCVIWMILNIAETYFNYPLFWALMFYGLLKIDNEKNSFKRLEIRPIRQ